MNALELMKKRFVSVDKNETIGSFLGKVYKSYKYTYRDAVVFDKGKFVGMTSKRFLIKTKIDPQTMKVSKIIEKPPMLKGKEDVVEIARLMYTGDRQIIPVIQKNEVIGVVRAIDVIEQIKKMPDLRNIKLGDISAKPITIKENDRIGKAVEMMREKKISRIPIVDNKGKLLNIISLRDIIHHYLFFQLSKNEKRGRESKGNAKQFDAKENDARALPVKNLATPVIITETEDANVSIMIDDLKKFNISSVVITRYDEPVGIVTVRDLLKLFLREQITY